MRAVALLRSIPLVVLLLLPAVAFPVAAETPTPPSHIERIAKVGQLWGYVRYLHPYVAYRDVDWNAALLAALPRVRDAKSREEYSAAVQSMLATLGDPATRVMSDQPPLPAPPAEQPLFRKLEDGIAVLDLGATRALTPDQMFEQAEGITKDLAAAPAMIVDLRDLGQPNSNAFWARRMLGDLQWALISRPSRAPAQRYLLHSGYRPQEGQTSGGYHSGFLTLAADTFAPSPQAPATTKRVVFLVGRWSGVPTLALALQAAGDGRIVAEGEVTEESVIEQRPVDLGEGLSAAVRVSELVPFAGWNGFHVDAQVPEGQSEAAFAAALAEARRPVEAASAATSSAPSSERSAAAVQSLPDAVFRRDPTYHDMLAPGLEHRWLAVIRAWNVIDLFYPYLHLLDDWDAVLPEFLARMETAESGRDYAVTLQEMMARVADGHTSLGGHPELRTFFGSPVPLEVRWVENAPVVTAIWQDSAREAGVQIGDALLAVDGEPVAARMERLRKYLPGSTEATVRQRVCRALTRGPDGSTAVLSLQGVDGTLREVKLTRDPKALPIRASKEGETVRILPGNIGYMDLTRLTVAEVPAAFEKVKLTRALVFDMRGYPNGTAWSIAPRINTRNAKVGAQFRRSQISAFSVEESESGFFFAQPLPEGPPDLPKYTQPTVMLIDDRAISQSEHSGLFFEAANGTRFIGTASAGANGDVTSFTLPGGISVYFTGHDVRHADGRQLQRVGLIPDVEVAPTRAGLKAGKDEVLDRAMLELEKTLAGEGKAP
jgi:C-terminal processing protease CtpA/Prc